MDERSARLELWFLALAFLLAALLIVGTILTWTDQVVDAILLGIATSFIFVVITDLAFRARVWFSETRLLREFFGIGLASRKAYAVYTEFELVPPAEAALKETYGTRYWRKAADRHDESDQPIEFAHAVAGNDIEAILDVASILRRRPEPLTFLCDQDFPRRREDQAAMSLIAPGLTANAAVAAYLNRRGTARSGASGPDASPLFELEQKDEHPLIHVANGPNSWLSFYRSLPGTAPGDASSPAEQYGIILRHTPDPQRDPGTRWIIVAGLERIGTPAAAWVLRHQWRGLRSALGREHRSSDFLAVVKVTSHDIDPRDRDEFREAVQHAQLVHLAAGPSAERSVVLPPPAVDRGGRSPSTARLRRR